MGLRSRVVFINIHYTVIEIIFLSEHPNFKDTLKIQKQKNKTKKNTKTHKLVSKMYKNH